MKRANMKQTIEQSELPFGPLPLAVRCHGSELRAVLLNAERRGYAADRVSFRRGNRVRVQLVPLNPCAANL